MIERRSAFGPDDLPGDERASELATSLALGRELETMSAEPFGGPSVGFADRVMAAIALEPVPSPAATAGEAARSGRWLAFLAALRDAWRVSLSGGRPLAVRAQALALVLVTTVAIGAILSAGGFAVAGALGLFDARPGIVAPSPLPSPSPVPTPSVAPTAQPTPTLSPPPTLRPTPSATAPGETAEPTDDLETVEPGATDDHGGGDVSGNSGPGGGSGSGSGSSGPGGGG